MSTITHGDRKNQPVLALTGGGTGGHVIPALAVLDELGREGLQDFRVVWFGSRGGMEERLVEQWSADRGIPVGYVALPAGKLRRYLSLRNIMDAFKFAAGMAAALFSMARLRPVMLFSKGGFVSVAPVFAAGILGIPVISHESDYDPGLATRLNMRHSRIMCIPFEDSRKFYSAGLRVECTGNPVRRDLSSGSAEEGRKLAGFHGPEARDLPVLLVQGGSLGARQINELIRPLLPGLLESMCIIHQTGDPAWDPGLESGGTAGRRYFSRPFFANEYPHVLAAADLVLSRSGAGSLWELGTRGKAAVFIPLSAGARGDQLRNAEYARSRGAALVLSTESEFGSLGESLAALAADPERRAAMCEAWNQVVHDRGTGRIAALVRETLNGASH